MLQHADVTELPSRHHVSLVSRHTRLSLALLAHGQMKRDLVLEILLELTAVDNRAPSKPQITQPLAHAALHQIASSTRLIALLARRQDSVVSRSRLRPLGVRR